MVCLVIRHTTTHIFFLHFYRSERDEGDTLFEGVIVEDIIVVDDVVLSTVLSFSGDVVVE